MEIGLIKSKVEKLLQESYVNNNLKNDIFIFEELVLRNKNIKKLFFIYDELSSGKNLNESLAKEFVNEMTILYENTINKVREKDLKELAIWTSQIKSKNNYKNIDLLFSRKLTDIENKVKSKNEIVESLKKSPVIVEQQSFVPLDSMVNIANNVISKHIETLNESSRKELKKVLTESDEKLQVKFEILKETVCEKLDQLKENESEKEVLDQIEKTIQKVKNENFDRLNYVKLKELYKNI